MLKHFKLFEQHSEYESYINSKDKLLPNLSFCKREYESHLKHYFHDVSLYGDIEGTTLKNYYLTKDSEPFYINNFITPGYAVNDISIFMDNNDITENSYENYNINISDVTADISINIDTASVTNSSMFIKRTTGNGINIQNNKALLNSIYGNTLNMNLLWYFKASGLRLNVSSYADVIDKGSDTNSAYAENIWIKFHLNKVDGTDLLFSIGALLNIGDTYYNKATIKLLTNPTGLTSIPVNIGSGTSSGWYRNPTVVNRTLINNECSFDNIYTPQEISGYTNKILMIAFKQINNWVPEEGIDIEIKNINTINLSLMFGKGKEPKDISYVRKLFTLNLYNRTTGTKKNNKMTNYISKRYDAVGIEPEASYNSTWFLNSSKSTLSKANGIFTYTYPSGETQVVIRCIVNTISGHKYYARAWFKSSSGQARFTDNGGNGSAYCKLFNLAHDGTWEKRSCLRDNDTRIDIGIQGGTAGDTIQIKYPLLIDLTVMFGKGNEPTIEICDSIFDQWEIPTANIFNTWNLLQNININIPTLTGKLNGEGDSLVIFPNGMKSTVCLPSITPNYLQKSDSIASYFDLDYVPTGNDIVIKTKIRYNSYIGSTYYLPWFTTKTSGWNETLGDNFYGILRRTNTNGNIYAFCGNKNYTEITGLTTATVYEIELSNGNLKLNGTDYTLDTTAGNENTYSMKLLAGLNAYLYYYQIYKGEDLVVDCIPYRDANVVGLYDRARDRIFTLTQISEEGTINAIEPAYEELPDPTYDEIKQDNGIWKAYKRISNTKVNNAANTGREEYVPLAQKEVYILDDQSIPTVLNVVNQGIEEILPVNDASILTTPAIMEIQYGSTDEN